MKRFVVVLLSLCFAVSLYGFSAHASDEPIVGAGKYEHDGYVLNYRYYVPEDADTVSYPLVLYLHTAGERGSDNVRQLGYGLPLLLFRYGMLEDHPAISIFPQAGTDEKWVDVEWDAGTYSIDYVPETPALGAALSLARSAAEKYNADQDRMYVTGISMGGYGTWDLIARYPGVFAAAVPICGGGDPSAAEKISQTPERSYNGDLDDIVPVSGDLMLDEALSGIGADASLTVVPGGDNFNIWQFAYEDSIDWMFSQKKELSTGAESDPGIHIDEKHSKLVAAAALIGGIGILALCSYIAYKLFYLLALHYLNNKR